MTDQPYRLPAGGRVDRSRPLAFRFDGKRYRGYAGDTLASALLANGVHLVARSFKYHRPRGILSAGAEEPNALVQLERDAHAIPNARATQVELYEGLQAFSQNCWPGVRLDVGVANNALARLLPAGFYYKTFMRPRRLWRAYEYFIRQAAGLGRAPAAADPDRYDKIHAHCDVLVVGGGPTGLAAALAAGRTGARVILADEQSELGGSLLADHAEIDGKAGSEWTAAAVAELPAMAEMQLLTRSTVTGYYDHNYLVIVQRLSDHLGPAAPKATPRQRLWKVRARQVVLATGAHERPLVFVNNDRPGIMLANAARAYVKRYAVKPGTRAVVFTNNDSAYSAALDLAAADIEVAAIVDVRRNLDGPLATEARSRGIEVLTGHAVVSAHGGQRVRAVAVRALNETNDSLVGAQRLLQCDLVCLSGGWNPAVHLFSQSRGRLRWDSDNACFVPAASVQAERSAGAANGAFVLARCLAEGHAAGRQAAERAGFSGTAAGHAPSAPVRVEAPLQPFWAVPLEAPGDPGKQFIDFHNDVSAADIALAAREGYRSVEHAKRYTTAGMGTDQGKTGNVNALAALARTLGIEIAELGTTTFRPPYTPLTFGAMAGRDRGELADPVRVTPMHGWHEANGACFEDVGQWKRPWYYARAGETLQEAVRRECLAARKAVGILDASTLGKIDIQGPDAVELLNRMYTNNWDDLRIGRSRYGLMCTEDGMVFDDGVTTRIGQHRYWMTTTSGNAARVLAWIEEWLQTEWPELEVYCNSMTEHWATVAIAGPRARRLLAKLTEDIDLDRQAFPFMSHREGIVAGIAAKVFRISFTGELSYEINVPARYGLALWTALMTAGAEYGITPFGTETLHVLRAEKGYIIAGQETDGTVTPVDLGMARLVSQRKDFLGKRSLARSAMTRPDRKQLVGLLTLDPEEVLPEGGQIVAEPKERPPVVMVGHVTSSYRSACLGRSIALALVKGGRARLGEIVHVPLERKTVRARIVRPTFYDLEGARLDG